MLFVFIAIVILKQEWMEGVNLEERILIAECDKGKNSTFIIIIIFYKNINQGMKTIVIIL